MDKGRNNLRASLRRWQLESAKKGNVAMLIWLGKQILQQTDKIEQVSHLEVKQLTPQEIEKVLIEDPFAKKADK
jgi:hypothetical protein